MSVLVLGAGGHAKVVVSTLQAAGLHVDGILDDAPGSQGKALLGVPVIGPIEPQALSGRRAIIGIGSNEVRRALAERLRGVDVEWVQAVHPHAWVGPEVNIGEGCVVFAGATLQPGATLGLHVIVNTGASVDHDSSLGDYVHIGPGCRLAGGVRLAEGAFMGVGSAAIPGARIGAWAIVGAGGVVVSDIPDRVVATGVPARPR